ncbi:DNA-binding response regulator, OmpR family, contains REC and winged-helix (wHTH) domain [Seinonella peptonophila]|uniref:Heme response regulator HssR n=1 Tax=Seinonella peptonophila TaxID=112248 RepID=A0A1M4T9D2_9BACL|nr:response regulator transcription factor [Seinonella peptonophila]SHE41106.1 DNA-binding response regulator, OmpR family, contains REC and winged-helix (wHTH) domain [Seinonella peptonophila]
MYHIMIVDDDEHIRELVYFHLNHSGYVVQRAIDGLDAMRILKEEKVHLAIVDLMMPRLNGYELCEKIRLEYDIPIILLTAKDQLVDKEEGFKRGADDYLVKPFEPKELLFRIKALLRRFQMINVEQIRLHQTVIDRKSYEVRRLDQTIILPFKEFELFSQLASHPNRVFTRQELIQLIWGADFEGDERTVDVHIKRLRERFNKVTDDFIIQTVRGVGYKLEVMEH